MLARLLLCASSAMHPSTLVRAGFLALVASTAAPRLAHACGGCFSPPGIAQVVTDHRMVLSLSATQTTLWDQFQYSGSPTEFSWILPIANGPQVQIHLADDRFMTLLDNATVPEIFPPQRPFGSCPYPPFAGAAADASFADAASDTGVVVYQQEVVGPYDVAVIGGQDPMAIRNWLSTNGYVVTPAVSPIIDWYTTRHMDFLALRLHPGEGTDRMSPVRVTVPGYAPSLPLRMISAGVADSVGLVLLVIADGRIEAANYPNGEVRESSLTYDFAAPTNPATDFLAAENALRAANGGRTWVAESAMDFSPYQLQSQADATRYYYRGPDAGTCDPDAGGANDGGASDAGMASQCTDPVQDMTVALTGFAPTSVRVTRLRAVLPASQLDQDLMLQASTGGTRDRVYRYGNVLHTPPPPVCDSNPDAGQNTDSGHLADGAAAPPNGYVAGGGCTTRCSVGRSAPSRSVPWGWLAAASSWIVIRRRRRGR